MVRETYDCEHFSASVYLYGRQQVQFDVIYHQRHTGMTVEDYKNLCKMMLRFDERISNGEV